MVKIDKNINLLDSPGVLFSPNDDEADLALRNCLKVDQLDDPVDAVNKILAKCAHERLMELYNIASFSDTDEFLYHIAVKRNKVLQV